MMFKLYTEDSDKGEGGGKKAVMLFEYKELCEAFMLTISFLHFPLSCEEFL